MPTIPLLRCLGPFKLEWQGQSITLPTRKTAALLAYLVLHPEVHPRTRLVTLFWGDFGEDAARRSLRTALSVLRNALGDACLVADREMVQFNPHYTIWNDARVLQAQARHFLDQPTPDPSLVDITLYQGDLLAGMEDDWILRTREELRLLYLQVLLRLAQHWRTQGDYTQAIATAQRILTLEPAEEAAHQLLIFCYIATGDRQAAHRQYEVCVRALREELDVAPTLDTVTLYRRSQRTPPRAPLSAAVQTNLPLPLSSFIGRSHEIARLTALLSGTHAAGERQPARLVTVTGPGGCGKTRLAIQVVRALLDQYSAGVWWVDLAPLHKESQVPQALASVFSVEQGVQASLTAALVNYLRPQHLLILLDNCEHLIAACATLVEHLLNYCPNLQILATSREALNIGGEISWLVPSLTLPGPQSDPALNELLQYEAIRLFVERASTAQRDFALTVANAPAACQICQQLDGIPLAIELAAARIKSMTVEQIATRLAGTSTTHFALLAAGGRTMLPRQQTLRATIEWSYVLLSEPEQRLLQQLTVFVGGWSLEAAEIVGGESGPEPVPILLAQLVDKSLVLAEPQGDVMRYRMLETIRQYTYEQLEKSGQAATGRDRHWAYFLHLVEQAEPEFQGSGQLTWLRRLDADYENLRAALTWSLPYESPVITRLIDAATLATALIFYWKLHGDWLEGRYWLQRAEQLCAEAPKNVDAALIHRIRILHAKALYGIGVMAWHQENWDEAQHLLEASVALWRATGDQTGLYRAQIYQADLYLDTQNSTVAFALLHECLAYFRQVQDRWNLAHTLFFLAYGERRGGNYAVATYYYEECIPLLRTLGEHWLLSLAISHLGIIAYEQGDYATAVPQIEQRLHMGREFGLKHHMYTSLHFLASIAVKQGDIRRAAMLIQEKIRIQSKAGIAPLTCVVDALGPIALVCAMDGQKERAVHLLAATDVFSSVTMREYWKANDTYRAHLTALRTQLGEAAFLATWAAGAAITAEQALEEAVMKD